MAAPKKGVPPFVAAADDAAAELLHAHGQTLAVGGYAATPQSFFLL